MRARLPDFFAFLRRPPHEGLWPYHCELGIRNCTLSGGIMFIPCDWRVGVTVERIMLTQWAIILRLTTHIAHSHNEGLPSSAVQVCSIDL